MAGKSAASSRDKYITVPSKLVHLDGDNPRHDPLEREPDIIAKLCDSQLVALATDIARIGSLSPLEILGVIEYDGLPSHYVSVEGNRRTCALLLLSDPSRAPSEYREIFRKLAKEGNIPRELRVFVFPDRASAQPWIDRRHLGAQGGIGTREWDSDAKARAAKRTAAKTTAKADVLALAVRDRLVEVGLLDAQQRVMVSITTLSRYLNNTSRRAILGLKGVDEEGRLIYTHAPSEVDQTLLQMVLDSLPTPDRKQAPVHSRSNAAERDAYVQRLAASGRVPVTPLAQPATPAFASSPAAQPKGAAPRARSSANPANRNKLMQSSFSVKSKDKTLLRLRSEMLGLPIDEHEFAANYLLRAFVERVLVLYYRRNDPKRPDVSDFEMAQACAADAKAESAPRKVLQVLNQNASKTAIAHSMHTLGTAVHLGTIPVRRHLVAAFDTWEPALKYMLDAM
ncbi:hypothetical protein ACKI2N_002670 [Cupriavidus sp. 30B13]|uniref:hypothetical protein n=1 Tax=Cupriavidus sp. 30B13 TaxID=3384241 RepID=UPI003B8EF336